MNTMDTDEGNERGAGIKVYILMKEKKVEDLKVEVAHLEKQLK